MQTRQHGEGSIRQKANGRWEARYRAYDPLQRKRRQYSIVRKTQKEALSAMNNALYDIELGLDVRFSNITVSEWATLWLERYKAGIVKPATFDAAKTAIQNHLIPHLGNRRLRDIFPVDIQQLLGYLVREGSVRYPGRGLAPSTVVRTRIVLLDMFQQAVANRYILTNPVEATKAPMYSPYQSIRILSGAELEQFLKVLDDNTYANILRAAIATGMRLGEIIALEADCISYANDTIFVKQSASRVYNQSTGKTELIVSTPKSRSSYRQIPMLPSIKSILKRQEDIKTANRASAKEWVSNNLVFPNLRGRLMEPRNVTRYYKKKLKAIDCDVSFHALRHSFTTNALNTGVSIKTLATIMGHKSVATTLDIYVHYMAPVGYQELLKMEALYLHF